MADRIYLQLRPTDDPNVFITGGDNIIRTDDATPEYSPESRLQVIEITGRTGGPFNNLLYDVAGDSFSPRPPPPGPTSDQIRTEDLETTERAGIIAMDALIDSDASTWTITQVARALKILLRQARIDRLRGRNQ